MKVEIKIDKSCTESKIIIVTNKITEEINRITKKLTSEQSQILVGFKDEKVLVLDPNQIYRVYATNAKVYAETEFDTLLLKLRLYEIEERLDPNLFVRISNSEIIKEIINPIATPIIKPSKPRVMIFFFIFITSYS